MKKFIFLLFVYLMLAGFTFAQEAPKYNFGSAQGTKNLTLSPGKEVTSKLFFYNVFGNRTTHISLSLAEAPSNWRIEFLPELKTERYDVAGILTEVKENLALEPNEIVQEIPEEKKGFTFIPAPNVGGFIPAKEVLVKISVPENEEIGKTFSVKVDAEASWLGQLGTVAFKQGRTFEFNVTVVAEEFYERKVDEAPLKKERARESAIEGITPLIVFVASPLGIALIVLGLILLIGLFFKVRKQKRNI